MSASRPKGRQDSGQNIDRVHERILQAFSQKAKRVGLRSVVMGELASELRMSASTLYKYFSSKEELVLALVERWVMELAAAEALTDERPEIRSTVDRVRHWAEVWSASMSELSVAFIQDLQREYPDAWKLFSEGIEERKRVGSDLLRPLLKPELHPEVALEILNMTLARVADPKFSDQMETSRSEAIQTAVSLWASGAIAQEGAASPIRKIHDTGDGE